MTEPKPPATAGAGEPSDPSLQDRYAPDNACFGCGPRNAKGLRLKSHVAADGSVVASFRPEAHHEAFPGVLNGGIIGALLDCHSNWTAAHALMLARGDATPPCTVTAEFHVKLRHPTPTDVPVSLVARPVQVSGGAANGAALPDRCTVDAELSCGGKVTATCRGLFVAVSEGHPAYHRW
ncbi:MAG TPA: PaaI family thioesterase [Polyangiaceae bacterium]|nr:PaaI family thioesterase [Polyangiaceae bacterium]